MLELHFQAERFFKHYDPTPDTVRLRVYAVKNRPTYHGSIGFTSQHKSFAQGGPYVSTQLLICKLLEKMSKFLIPDKTVTFTYDKGELELRIFHNKEGYSAVVVVTKEDRTVFYTGPEASEMLIIFQGSEYIYNVFNNANFLSVS